MFLHYIDQKLTLMALGGRYFVAARMAHRIETIECSAHIDFGVEQPVLSRTIARA